MEYAIMDDNGIIETFNSNDELYNSVDRVRKENHGDIEGDLKGVKILFCEN